MIQVLHSKLGGAPTATKPGAPRTQHCAVRFPKSGKTFCTVFGAGLTLSRFPGIASRLGRFFHLFYAFFRFSAPFRGFPRFPGDFRTGRTGRTGPTTIPFFPPVSAPLWPFLQSTVQTPDSPVAEALPANGVPPQGWRGKFSATIQSFAA